MKKVILICLFILIHSTVFAFYTPSEHTFYGHSTGTYVSRGIHVTERWEIDENYQMFFSSVRILEFIQETQEKRSEGESLSFHLISPKNFIPHQYLYKVQYQVDNQSPKMIDPIGTIFENEKTGTTVFEVYGSSTSPKIKNFSANSRIRITLFTKDGNEFTFEIPSQVVQDWYKAQHTDLRGDSRRE